jgi:cytochrome c
MTGRRNSISAGFVILALFAAPAVHAEGDPARGVQAFGACAACHSLKPGEHLTGPSLATVYGRKAGSIEGFQRYSTAVKRFGVTWNEQSLDAWLRNPAAFIPGNLMIFEGLPDAQTRADLIAYLKGVAEGKVAAAPAGAGGMMAAPRLPDLKKVRRELRVGAIRHCGDAYFLTMGNGETLPFWEFNLRFKTDSSANGPAKGQPVLVGAGMMGDRAQVVFSHPGEISAFIKSRCE